MFLGLLPFFVLVLMAYELSPSLGAGSTRRGILRSAVLWGVLAVLGIEGLSVLGNVNRFALSALWGSTALVLVFRIVMRARQGPNKMSFRSAVPQSRATKILAVSAVVVAVLTGVVAVVAPPNTWDSLNYHMPRVAHWMQMGAVRHYPTGIETQNTMPPGAELLVLHTYGLAHGDRWSNLPQWFAMLGSLVAISYIAKQLGAGRTGQWLAVLIAATLPAGIVQASSNMTDYITGFWILCVAAETAARERDKTPEPSELIWVGAAAGLSIVTKPTGFAFLLPFAVYWAAITVKSWRDPSVRAGAAVGFAIVLLVNVGHWSRNYSVYGHPIGDSGRIGQHGSPILGGRAFLSNLTRNLAMHMGTPSPHVNKAVAIAVQETHALLNLDVNDPRTTVAGPFKVRWATLQEDSATNPLHLYAVFAAIGLMSVGRLRSNREFSIHLSMLIFAFLTFSLLFQWIVFGGRLQLPLFLLACPLVAVAAQESLPVGWMPVLGFIFFLAASPWLLLLQERPLLSSPSSPEASSVLLSPREDLYFKNAPYLKKPFTEIVSRIERHGCTSVRLQLGGGEAEYPLWVLLRAPFSDVRIGWAVAGADSAEIDEGLPRPCAIICHECAGTTPGGVFELATEAGSYSLFLEE